MTITGDDRQAERVSHAVYGLIIITSSLVADRAVAEDAATSLLVLWGAGIVLLLAHLYSALLARIGEKGHWLTYAERNVLISDNVPLLAAVLVPSLLLLVSAMGGLPLAIALDLGIVLSIGALFGMGSWQARRSGGSTSMQVTLGVLGGVIGSLVIALEVILAH